MKQRNVNHTVDKEIEGLVVSINVHCHVFCLELPLKSVPAKEVNMNSVLDCRV